MKPVAGEATMGGSGAGRAALRMLGEEGGGGGMWESLECADKVVERRKTNRSAMAWSLARVGLAVLFAILLV